MPSDGKHGYKDMPRRGARGTADIVADMLLLCGEWTRKTKIMYKANLSHQMLKFYLWHTVELGLLEDLDGIEFRITERGNEFLSHYHNMSRLLAGMGGSDGRQHSHFVAQSDK